MPFPTPLTPFTIQSVFQVVTLAALGLGVPVGPIDPLYALVRVDWQTQGQPTGTVTEDMVYVRAVEEDNPYNRIREVTYQPIDSVTMTHVTSYTRVWRVDWTLYGPNSFDRARVLRSAMFSQATHDQLAGSQLYLLTDVAAPQRVPEFFQEQWWERTDFSVLLNEFVTETAVVGSVGSVEIIVEDVTGERADFTVTA